MTIEQKQILQLLGYQLFGRHFSDENNYDFEKLYYEAKAQGVSLFVFEALKSMGNPPAGDKWNDYFLRATSNNVLVTHNHVMLHKWMTENNIPYVILKGCASEAYYEHGELRMMGDVDFYIPRTSLQKAREVLRSKGLAEWDDGEKHAQHIVFRGKRSHYEMHFNLAGMPTGDAGEIVSDWIKDICETARPYETSSGTIMIPSDFNHGLVLLLHTCHHLTGEGIGLRQLCDWAVFVNSISDQKFRSLFEERLKQIGLWKFAQVFSSLAVHYLGMPKRSWTEVEDKPLLTELMEDILAAGNFGRKDNERQNQSYIISSRGKEGVKKKGMLGQAVKSMNNVVFLRWPAAKKAKVLLPAGWIFFGGRHAIRIMRGKRRPVHVKKMIAGAAKRKEIYSRLGLYEVGEE